MGDFEVKITSNAVDAKRLIKERTLVALEKCGLMAENYAKRNCIEKHIVDTGALRYSITHIVDESEPCAACVIAAGQNQEVFAVNR